MRSVEVNPGSGGHVRRQADIATALWHRPVVLGLLLVVATVALYYPAHRHPFVKYDDNDYVYENVYVQAGLGWETVKWAFTTSHAANWHPLTWLSHALDSQIFGLKAAGPHDVNIFFHALNAVLVFWVLLRATGLAGRSFMVAALFAVHPINVEAVVWIAERKTLLSTMFFLLALGAYRWYASRPHVGRYSVVALLFALGLMAKPQIITLPCVLLLWDYWPLGRLAFRSSPCALRKHGAGEMPGEKRTAISEERVLWLILEKAPLLAIAAASAVITLKVQGVARTWFPLMVRVKNAVLSYGLYVKNALWPNKLTLLYPHPGASLSRREVLTAGLILLVITGLVMAGWRRRYLPVGWFWFLGTLIPMIGLVQVGLQAMADRYAYVSFLGLFIIVCWGAADFCEHAHLPAGLLPSISLAVLLILALLARRQINYWQTDEGLWSRALQVTTSNWVAESQLGSVLAMDGRVEEAMPHFYKAIAISPTDRTANMGVAIYQLQTGNFSEAVVYYQRVLDSPGEQSELVVNAWVGMAKAYRALGDKAKSRACLEQAKVEQARLVVSR